MFLEKMVTKQRYVGRSPDLKKQGSGGGALGVSATKKTALIAPVPKAAINEDLHYMKILSNRKLSQDREIMILMGVDTKRLYLLTSAIGGGLAGLGAALLVLQYDVHPFIGLSFGPITFMICVMGGLGNLVGGFLAAFVFSSLITVGGYFAELEWGYVMAFTFFIAAMFARPKGLFARNS